MQLFEFLTIPDPVGRSHVTTRLEKWSSRVGGLHRLTTLACNKCVNKCINHSLLKDCQEHLLELTTQSTLWHCGGEELTSGEELSKLPVGGKAVSKHLGRLPQTGCGELLLIALMFPMSRQAKVCKYRYDSDALTNSSACDPV